MNTKIYVRRFGKLIALQKISRTSGGIYFISPRSSSDYVSYHEDGKYWIRSSGKKFIKKIRQPLSSFSGAETLSSSVINIWAPSEGDRDEALVSMRNNDVVVNFPSTFGIEIILSDTLLTFPEFGGRTNGRVIVRETKPLIFIEIFEFQGQPLLSERFPTPIDWLENSNFFVNHPGRI